MFFLLLCCPECLQANCVRLRVEAWVHLPHKAEMAQQQLLLGHLGFVVLPCVTLLISDLELGFVLVFTGQSGWQNAMVARVVDEIALGVSEFVIGAVDQVNLVEISRQIVDGNADHIVESFH